MLIGWLEYSFCRTRPVASHMTVASESLTTGKKAEQIVLFSLYYFRNWHEKNAQITFPSLHIHWKENQFLLVDNGRLILSIITALFCRTNIPKKDFSPCFDHSMLKKLFNIFQLSVSSPNLLSNIVCTMFASAFFLETVMNSFTSWFASFVFRCILTCNELLSIIGIKVLILGDML